MVRRRAARVAIVAVVALVACHSSSESGSAAPAPFVARYVHASGARADLVDVPFPSDGFVDSTGKIGFPIGTNDSPLGVNKLLTNEKGAQYLADAFAHSPGFGTYGGAFFVVDGTSIADATSLPVGARGDCTRATDAAFFFDVDAGAPLECRVAWVDERPFGDEAPPVLTVRTARGVVVPEGHRVLAVLTDRIRAKDGNALQASEDFVAVRDGRKGDAMESSLASALDAIVGKLGVDRSHVVAATTYVTGHVTDDLRKARELAAATPVPRLAWDAASVAPVAPAKFTNATPLPAGWTASLDDDFGQPRKLDSGPRAGEDDPDWATSNTGVAHDAIGAVGVATFEAPSFLIPTGGDYSNADFGTFYHDASGALAIDPDKPTAKIWVTFVVPKTPPPSAAGYPVVVFQHGLGGQRDDCFQIANTFAHQGWATAAIEVVLQGTRANDANARGDKHNDSKRSTSKYDGPDGFSDRASDGTNAFPIDLFGGLFRLAAFRDQLRQSAIDHTTLVRLLQSSPTLDGLTLGGETPKIDGSKIAYMGDSLGGITGAIVSGIEPNHRAYILNVPGVAILTELAPNAPELADLVSGATGLFFGVHGQTPPAHPLLQMVQHVMDGGDPIGVVGSTLHGSQPRNVLVFEAVRDEIVANESTDALARAMGIPVIVPHEPTLLADLQEVDGTAGVHDVPIAGMTAVMIQLSPAEHGYDLFVKPGHRNYSKDGPDYGDPSAPIFPKLDPPYVFENPYLDAQAAAIAFIADAFAGKVPNVVWTKVPEAITR
jgi:hypothetical protein